MGRPIGPRKAHHCTRRGSIVPCAVVRLEGNLSVDEQLVRMEASRDAGLLASRFSGRAARAAKRESLDRGTQVTNTADGRRCPRRHRTARG